MDVLHSILNWIDHNRWAVIMPVGVVALVLSVGMGRPKTESVLHPGEEVTATQLEREAALFVKEQETTARLFEIAAEDLAVQAGRNEAILETIGGVATSIATGGVNVPALIAAVITLASVGLNIGQKLDGRRKDGVITTLKNGT